MSILINGMEMPTTCGECKIKNIIECDRWKRIRSVVLDRHRDCPLVPVPPHGRVIDVDKVLDELAHNLGIRSLDYLTPSERAIVSWFRDAHTVIPAEPPKEKEA